jgi:hypothetical protein
MPQIMVRNIADFERSYAAYDVDGQMKDLFAFDPDLVVLAIGENVPALNSEDAKARFKAGVMNILGGALAKRHPLVVGRSCCWADPAKDQMLRQACDQSRNSKSTMRWSAWMTRLCWANSRMFERKYEPNAPYRR